MVLTLFVLLALLMVGGAQAQPAQTAIEIHDLRVRKHASVSNLTSQDVAYILAQMGEILQDDDDGVNGVEDVKCMVGFSGGLDEDFQEGTGVINTETELYAVLNVPGEVKIVDAILYCDKPAPDNHMFFGCARMPGFSFVVAANIPQAAVTWTHEFGHNAGLPDSSIERKIMNGDISLAGERVDQSECGELHAGQRAR